MPARKRSSRRPQRPDSVTATDRKSADRALQQQEERRRKADAALAQKVDRIVEEGRRQAQEVLGRKSYAELRAKIRSERLALRELGQPPEGLKRDHEKDTQAGKRRVDALLRGLGAKRGKLERIRKDTSAKVAKLLAPDPRRVVPGYGLAGHGDTWRKLTGFHPDVLINPVIAPPEDPNDPYRWFQFGPNYSTLSTSVGPWIGGTGGPFGPIRYGNIDDVTLRPLVFSNAAGWLGSDLALEGSDQEYNFAYRYYRSGAVLRFTPPASGRLVVVIGARCLWDTRKVSFADQWGFSDASIRQENSLFVSGSAAAFPDEFVAPMSDITTSTDGDNVSKNFETLIPGNWYYAVMVSQAPVAQGVFLSVTVGSHHYFLLNTNDMKAHCQSIFLWDIHSIWMRIQP